MPVPDIIVDVERTGREDDWLELPPPEDLRDPIPEPRPSVVRVDVALGSAHHLGEVRLGEEAHRCARPIVEVLGFGDEALARLFDEADVGGGTEHRVTQLFGCQPLELLVECQGVDEGGPGDIGGERRKPRVVLGVDLLREPFLLRTVARDVVADCRDVCALLEPRDDLLADRLVPGVDVVHVNRGCVRWPRFPQVRDGTREQPQHAPARAGSCSASPSCR